MLKFEIVKCIEPFNESFEKGKMYKSYPNKKGQVQVFVDEERHLIVPTDRLIISETPYYLNFFEPVETIMLPNLQVCKELNKKMDEVMEMKEKEDFQ